MDTCRKKSPLVLHMFNFLSTFPASPVVHLVLAHGAGAGMSSAFLEQMATVLSGHGVGVTRFEFDYMAQRRTGGTRRPPPKAVVLMDEYRAVVAQAKRLCDAPLYIGGKSMGGRIASMIADEAYSQGAIGGLVCLGYPFHPAGKPQSLRVAHLAALACPALIVQGERDALGSRAEIEGYTLSTAIAVKWLEDGDHDFKARKASGFAQADHIATATEAIAAFVRGA